MSLCRVLFCCNAYPPHFIGGAELIVEKWARALRREQVDAAVFAAESQTHRGAHYSLHRDEWNEVPVWRVQTNAQDCLTANASFVNPHVEARFEEVLDEFQPDVVHAHNLVGLSVQLLHLAHRRGLRTGLTLHDHWMFCVRNTLTRPDGTRCDPLAPCDCQTTLTDLHLGSRLPIDFRSGLIALVADEVDFFHFPSRYLCDMHVRWGLPRNRCHVIPNGIETERFDRVRRTPRPAGVRFAFIGHLGAHKGVRELVEAFACVPSTTGASLDFVGDGDLRSVLEQAAAAAGIGDRVRFRGKIGNDEIENVYRDVDCLVLPSQWPENHPVSINEAIACGIAVVATAAGGVPELVRHGDNGLLVPIGDTRALAQTLEMLARNPERVDSMGAVARRARGCLALDRAIDRLRRLYEEPARPTDAISRGRPVTVAIVGRQLAPDQENVCRALTTGDLRSAIRLVQFDWLRDTQRTHAEVLWLLRDDTSLDEVYLWSGAVVLTGNTSIRGPQVIACPTAGDAYRAITRIADRRDEIDDPVLRPANAPAGGDLATWLLSMANTEPLHRKFG